MNKHIYIYIFLFSLFCNSTFAQHSIQGKVLDKKDEGAIESATIRLLRAKDSTYLQSAQSFSDGSFSLDKVQNGEYLVEVSFLGYGASSRKVAVANKTVLLKNILLESLDTNLGEVQVTGMIAQMAVKNDTIEYNTAAFKTAENAPIEDLLKKLPGVVVDEDGKITINGEEIKKVRVDGKKFFGGDIQMATKNIPVDMIATIQVIDQKSEMAQLTGFEDENTERIINLTIKPNRKKGVYGNATVGGGIDRENDFRYNNNFVVNILDGTSQTALVGGANNSNKQRSGRAREAISGGSGITESQNLGANNNTELSTGLKIGGDGSYNHSNNVTETSTQRESWIKDVNYQNNSETAQQRENHQANMRLELECKLDSFTTMILQPEIDYSKGYTTRASQNAYFSENDSISWGNSSNSSENDSKSANLNVIFSRRSPTKKGRTFSFNLGGNFNESESSGHNYSEKTTKDTMVVVNQRNSTNAHSTNANLRVSFVEPLWNMMNFLELSATMRLNNRKSEKLQYRKGEDGLFNELDSVFSNNFENNFYNETVELNFRHQEPKYNYLIGAKVEPSQTYNTTYYKNGFVLSRPNEVINIAPTATYRYVFGKKRFARLEYRGRTNQPSIEQIQPVKNNNNLMHETIGNPLLNPSFEHTLRLMYSSFNAKRFSSFSIGLNGTYTKDALITNSIYDKTGKQYSQVINSDKSPYSANLNLMFNTPIIKNRLQFNTRTDISYQQRFGYSDRDKTIEAFDADGHLRLGKFSSTQNGSASQNLSLTFTTDLIEVGMRGNFRYSNTQNSLNSRKNQETKDWTGSSNINLHLPHNLTISTDLSYTNRQGYSSFDRDEWVWNANIDKSVFKRKGTISLKFWDILQQKLNIRENIGDNFRQLNRFNALTSYVMLSFTYKITRFGRGIRTEKASKVSKQSGETFKK
ncbi:MAG TPA: outer membrane beta-barrel protein [Bacteroidales bacterium]|nr:outer membrane beta-barrel protein [Bacteroidales bacterium]